MPTYEYVCRSCDTHLEVVQRFDEAALTECPSCGGALRKVFGNIGIAFKGSGFYKTDSRSVASAGNGAGAKADKADKADKAATGGEGGDSKSGSGSEAKGTTSAPAAKESGAKAAGPSSPSAPSTKSA